MPKSSFGGGLGRGFFRLDRSGPRLVIITEPSVNVDPFETDVTVVAMVATEPTLPAYGLPDDRVMEMPLSRVGQREEMGHNGRSWALIGDNSNACIHSMIELHIIQLTVVIVSIAWIIVCDGS